MTIPPLLAMMLSGIAGGFGHCISMCGPVVGALSVGETRKGLLHLLLYNLGRVTTYTILGGIVGLSGSFLLLAASIEALQRTIMIIAGLTIILMGLSTAEWLPLPVKSSGCSSGGSVMQKIMSLFKAPRSIGSYYPMGIVLGFLPCGLTYTALLASARAAMDAENPFAGMLMGALMMLLFGIGTAPALILVGKVVNTISHTTRKRFYRFASLIMIATGVWFIVSAW
ncbi:sulfite exporter TauE/SafE family protein [Chlorobium sp. BLA1]|uniref:sulfite exporter TauE/SafE family protein n=1 Tax=Candidatus Chlorobium masyuteum TaxID=2716876 RepID=UPI001423B17E|nr:sulfite exporter TauE/SafE family protein [Candidatus Chlorobium masyuteum]NHQ60157.1 sulfite exporter TauE/SafE family protein [Candidatus Chlorobium masyuteum]